MLKNLDMKNYVYGTRVINSDLKSNKKQYDKLGRMHQFKWTLEKWKWHTAKDWKPTSECGNGLHFWIDGVGDCSVTPISREHIWLLVRAKKSEVVNLERKAKAKSLQIINWGNQEFISALIKELKPEANANFTSYNYVINENITVGDWSSINTDTSHMDITAGDNCIIKVTSFAKVKAGKYCLISANYRSEIETGRCSKVFAEGNCKVKTGYGSEIMFDGIRLIRVNSNKYADKWLQISNNRIQILKEKV